MATEIGVAYLSIAASTGGLGKDIEKQLGGTGEAAGKKMGGGILGGVKGAIGPLAGVVGALGIGAGVANFLRDANDEARESQKVNAITANVIKQTGGAAKVTAGQIGDLATAISNKTGIDDEAVQASANLLLTFKQVRNEAGQGNDVFNRATAAAQDLAASGFGNANSAAKMLGKALNDPLKGMSALGRAGVTFTAEQQEQIKAMVKSGDVLGAQKIIMGEVESQVGGAAEASATAAEKISVKWGNLKETVGTAFVIPAVDYLAGKLSPVIDMMAGAVPKVQDFVKSFTGMGGGGAVSALSGLLTLMSPLSIAFRAVQPILPQVAAAFADMGGQLASTLLPVLSSLGPVIQQVVGVVVGSFTDVLTSLLPVVTQIASAVLPVLGQAIAAIAPVVIQLVQAFLPLLPVVADLTSSLLPPLAALIQGLIPAIMPLVGAALNLVQALLPVVGIVIQLVQSLIPPLMAVIAALIPPITEVVAQIAGALVPVFEAVGELIGALMPIISGLVGVIGTIVAAVAPVIAVIAGGLVKVLGNVIAIAAKVVTAIVRFVADGIKAIGQWAKGIADKVGEGIKLFTGLKDKILGALSGAGKWLVETGANLLKGLWNGISDTVGWLKDKIGGALNGVIDWVKDKFGIASPSKVFRDIGKQLLPGLMLGVTDTASKASSAIGKVISAITAAAANAAGKSAKKAAKKMADAAKKILAAQQKVTAKWWDDDESAAATTDRMLKALTGTGAWKAGTAASLKKATLADFASARDVMADRIKDANDKLKELVAQSDQLRDQIASSITGEMDLVQAMGTTRQAVTNTQGKVVGYTTTSGFAGISAHVKALAAKAKTFAGKLKSLITAGFPPGLVQEVAGLGTDNGIAVANSLLSASKAEQGSLISDYTSLQTAATQAGSYVATQMYGAGIAAQQGFIEGLLADDAKLVAAAETLVESLTKAVKKKLGIKSPSRVFRDQVGLMVAKGAALGLEKGRSLVTAAGRSLLDPSLIGGAPAIAGHGETYNFYELQDMASISTAVSRRQGMLRP